MNTINDGIEVTTLVAEVFPRYWEDSMLNGVYEEDDNPQMPCRIGNKWELIINLETGQIQNWVEGNTANIHYKVADAGTYHLLGPDGNTVVTLEDSYVPKILSPGGEGWEHIIMFIDESGFIEDWDSSNLSEFE